MHALAGHDRCHLAPEHAALLPENLLDMAGIGTNATSSGVRCQVDAQIPAQGYRLTVTADGKTVLESSDEAGLRHGLITLCQLYILHDSGHLPAIRITDAPTFATRGVMLDVSRDRIPTMQMFYEIIDQLCTLKFNHLQLYTEHTFAYDGHEEVWSGWASLTASEIRRLSEYAAQRGIELAANQNCFGHMVPWLKHARYAPLAETHGDWMFDIWPRKGCFSLCPTDPASLTLVKDLLTQLAECYTCPWVNIGADETYDIAYGRSKDEVAKRGRAAVYLEFVSKVAHIAEGLGKRPQFWGDIALSHPECVKDIPANLLPLAWGYEPDSPFEKWGQMLGGRDFWVCPGTSTWRTITGRTSERDGNLVAAAQAGKKYGASGYLVCDWGDTGHHQQWPISLHAFCRAAQQAWNPNVSCPADSEARIMFGTPDTSIITWLDELGDADLPLREVCGALSHPSLARLKNQTAIFLDMFKQMDEQREVGSLQLWNETLDRVETLASRLPLCANSLFQDELAHTVHYAGFAAARGALRRDSIDSVSLSRLTALLGHIQTEHSRLWKARSRVGGTGGLANSCTHFAKIADSMKVASSSTSSRVDGIKPQHGVTIFE